MTDLISRDDAIEEISKGVWNEYELIDRIKALPSAKTHEIRTETHGVCLISKDDALRELNGACSNWEDDAKVAEIINALPSAELVLQTPQTYGKSINPSNAEVVEDLISRADAMEEFREWGKRANENGETPTWNDAVSLIGSLPSADAAQGWIPCSERLPSEDGLYLIQTNYMYHGIPNMDVYYWAEGWNCMRLLNGMVKREYEIDGIVAWMPLPEPYIEEREEYELATEQMEHDALYEPTYSPEDGSM
jgi:hypothetical protein